jgi:secreted trypsin-like serine protease
MPRLCSIRQVHRLACLSLLAILMLPAGAFAADNPVCNCAGTKLTGPIPDPGIPLSGEVQTLRVPAGAPIPTVIGGTPTDPNEFVNVAKLLIQSTALNGTALCSGTLIDEEWVLTAAHCVTNSSNGNLLPNLQVSVEFSNGVTRNAVLAVKHPTYVGFVSSPQTGSIVGDICLLKLQTPVNTITPAEIQTSAPFVGQEVTLVGFGNSGTPRGGQQNGTSGIKRVGTQVIDQVTVEQTRWDFKRPETQSIAQGDSGGPQLNDSLAIVSLASGLTKPPLAPLAGWRNTVFNTRADKYFNWIQVTIATNSSPAKSVDPTTNLVPDMLTGLKSNPFLAPALSRIAVTKRVP